MNAARYSSSCRRMVGTALTSGGGGGGGFNEVGFSLGSRFCKEVKLTQRPTTLVRSTAAVVAAATAWNEVKA